MSDTEELERLRDEITRLTAERDTALAQVAAAYEAAEDAVNILAGDDCTIRWAMYEIRDLTPTDAQEALDKMLAKAREYAIREAALELEISCGHKATPEIRDGILALLNDGGRDE